MSQILCVDDDPAIGHVLERTLAAMGHEMIHVHGVPEALQVLARGAPDLILSDHQMPVISGLEFVEMLARDGVTVPVIMITGYGSVEHAVAALKAGAVDYLTKPFTREQLEVAVERGLGIARLRRENEVLRREVTELRGERCIVGESEAMRRVLDMVRMAAPTRATVLLQGESGTGKELLARAVHEGSDRRAGPFITLNCAALPEGLVESALFGHERGAFTGAVRRVEGAFERAHRGTLLLDEISEMPLALQAKLLRVLQEQEFERVGGSAPIRVDVRVIATTNRDLAAEAAAGRFRQDLFYRLNVVTIRVPALRERREDIPLLAPRFAQRAAADLGKTLLGIDPAAMATLERYDWPGNVRQLQHAVERAAILATGAVIEAHLFDGELTPAVAPAPSVSATAVPGVLPFGTDGSTGGGPTTVLHTLNLDEAEAILIDRALLETSNNRTRAAALLGVTTRTLRNKLNGGGSGRGPRHVLAEAGD